MPHAFRQIQETVMSFDRLPLLGAWALVGLALAPPVWAQALTPKDAWEFLHQFMGGAGLQLRTSGLLREGEAMVARDVVLSSPGSPAAFAMTMPEVRLEPAAAAVAIRPSGSFAMRLTDAEGAVRDYSFTHDGALTLTLTDEQIGLSLGFPTLALAQTGAQRDGRPLDEALRLSLADLAGQISWSPVSPVALEGSLAAARMDYALRMSQTEFMAVRQDATSQAKGVSLSFALTGLDQLVNQQDLSLAQAFANGLAARLELRSGPTTSTVDQTIGAIQTRTEFSAADMRTGLSLADGRVEFDFGVNGMALQGEGAGVAGSGTIAALNLAVGLPVVMKPEDEEFSLQLGISDLAVDRPLLERIGAGDFANDTATFEATVTALGRWLVEITEDPEPQDLPLELSRIALPRFVARLGSTQLTGSGSFSFTPGTFGQGEVPDGTGDFVLELTGGELALNRLAAAGLLPADQQFLARMLLNGLGRPVGPDQLRSEVAIRPGNQILVNGAPLPF
jgi:hypothetical protein